MKSDSGTEDQISEMVSQKIVPIGEHDSLAARWEVTTSGKAMCDHIFQWSQAKESKIAVGHLGSKNPWENETAYPACERVQGMVDKIFHRETIKTKGEEITAVEGCVGSYPIGALKSGTTSECSEDAMHITNAPLRKETILPNVKMLFLLPLILLPRMVGMPRDRKSIMTPCARNTS
jgi:hypothetical protein